MSVYLVISTTLRETSWKEAYQQNVPSMVAAYGGRYLTKSVAPVLVEGEAAPPESMAIMEFPSLDAVQAMMADPAYQPYLEARLAGASTVIYALDAGSVGAK